MKRKIIICVVFFILIILIQLKANAATEINLINKTDKYDLKNKTAFMEIETIKSNNKTYNIVFLSTEFYQNFLENSYYDQENQIFYFYGKNDDEYVKGNDSTYYYGDTILPLVQNLNVCTKVIDGRLYIPLPMYMQRIAYELKIGFDETSNSLLFFGPTRTLPSNASFPTIENVEIKEQIYDEALYYNLDNQGEISREYLTIDYLKTQIYGNVEYYTAIIDGKACVIRVYYEFTGSDCVYDRYEIINGFDGEDIKKLDEVGKYLIIKKMINMVYYL